MSKRTRLMVLVLGVLALMATPAFARSINLKDAGATLWIFILIGAVIVLLQLIPAAILFFSFIGTSSSMIFRHKKGANAAASGEESIFPRIDPAPAPVKR